MKILSTIVLSATLGLVAGCNQNNDTAPVADSTGVRDSMVRGKDEFMASMDKKMAEFDAKMDDFSARSKDYKDEAKAKSDKAVAELRVQRDALREEYDSMKKSSPDNWEKTKATFQTGWDDLVKHYDEARAKVSG